MNTAISITLIVCGTIFIISGIFAAVIIIGTKRAIKAQERRFNQFDDDFDE